MDKLKTINNQKNPASHIKKLIEEIDKEYPDQKRETMCDIVSIRVREYFDKLGIESMRLKEYITIAENDHLEHAINIIPYDKYYFIIDLTSKQIPWLEDKPYIVRKIKKDNKVLENFLKETYNWWFPPKKQSE